jgi:hypothetical protein
MAQARALGRPLGVRYMPDERDVWNTTFFHCAIRKRIGEPFSAGHDLSQPRPDTTHTLLDKLDESSARSIAGKQTLLRR